MSTLVIRSLSKITSQCKTTSYQNKNVIFVLNVWYFSSCHVYSSKMSRILTKLPVYADKNDSTLSPLTYLLLSLSSGRGVVEYYVIKTLKKESNICKQQHNVTFTQISITSPTDDTVLMIRKQWTVQSHWNNALNIRLQSKSSLNQVLLSIKLRPMALPRGHACFAQSNPILCVYLTLSLIFCV